MKIVIGSDHHGIQARGKIAARLTDLGHTVADLGTCSTEAVDYPDIAALVAGRVSSGEADRGILICGSGIGMAIAANKLPGVRAAPCQDDYSAEMSRRHNDANVLCLSDDRVDMAGNVRLAELWIATTFDGGRHQRRVDKITQLEAGQEE